MNRILLLIFSICISLACSAQSLVGAWEAYTISDDGEQIRNIVLFSKGYQVISQFKADDGAFIMTNGGSWILDGNTVTEVVEFDTAKPDRVGSTISFKVNIEENTMGIVGDKVVWSRIDDGTPGALQGAWLFSGRVRDGNAELRDTSRPRKTMKLMSGSRFQWIAYNTETKKFMGTGGGTYTTIDGEYIEHIEFFSKDNAKVGLSLKFDFRFDDGKWHHTGFSSKGDPIHEIWGLRD